MSTFLQNLRYSLRALATKPGFAVTSVLVLAIGIGANTAVFSLVNAAVLRPLNGAASDVVGLYSKDTVRPDTYQAFSYPAYRTIRDDRLVFASLLAQSVAMVGLDEGTETRRAFSALVSANYFSTLGVELPLGRAFSDAEEAPGSQIAVAIVSDGLWRRLGADPGLMGHIIRINSRSFTVIGVTPPGFSGTTAIVSPEVWLPLGMYELIVNDFFRDGSNARLSDPANHNLILAGRLALPVTPESVEARLEALSAQLRRAFPSAEADQTLVVNRLPRLGISTRPEHDSRLRMLATLLVATASVVLLVACLNLANMVLARGSTRQRELAIRTALGGGRGRLIGQLLTEGLVLAALGGVGGLLVAMWVVEALAASLSRMAPVAIVLDPWPDARVLLATLVFAGISTMLFSLGPAWRLTRRDLVRHLRDQVDGSSTGGRSRGVWSGRNALVVGQIALSLVLLTVGGLFVRGAQQAAETDPGFGLDGGLIVTIDPSLAGYDEEQGRDRHRTVLQRLRTVSGVSRVSLASAVPFGDTRERRSVRGPGTPDSTTVTHTIVGGDYFATLGVPLLRGREFTRAEETSGGGLATAIINQPLAERLWLGEDPLGRRIELESRATGVSAESLVVVGVVPGIRGDLLERVPEPHLYVPFGRHYRSQMSVHVRMEDSSASAATLLRRVHRTVRDVDAGLPILGVKTLRQHRDSSPSLWLIRTGARLFSTFGLLALILAIVGVYGVRAYVASRRTRELGIRMALGATEQAARWLVVREGVTLAAMGLALGGLMASGAARVLSGILYEVSPLDPVVFAAAPALLAFATLLACYLPARRATRLAVIAALRDQ